MRAGPPPGQTSGPRATSARSWYAREMETNDVLVVTLAAVLLSLASFALEAAEKALAERGWTRLASLLGAIRAYLPADAAGAKSRIKLAPVLVFVTALSGLSGCQSPLSNAITASNVALELGKSAAEELEARCTKPMAVLAVRRAGAPSELEKQKITSEAVELDKVCGPAVQAHGALRKAHRALVAILLTGLEGKPIEAALPPLLRDLAAAAGASSLALDGKKP